MVATTEHSWSRPCDHLWPSTSFSSFSTYSREVYKREHDLGFKGSPLGGNTLGNMSLEGEKLEEKEGGRKEGAFTSKFVHSLPFSMFFFILMVVIPFLEMF